MYHMILSGIFTKNFLLIRFSLGPPQIVARLLGFPTLLLSVILHYNYSNGRLYKTKNIFYAKKIIIYLIHINFTIQDRYSI